MPSQATIPFQLTDAAVQALRAWMAESYDGDPLFTECDLPASVRAAVGCENVLGGGAPGAAAELFVLNGGE